MSEGVSEGVGGRVSGCLHCRVHKSENNRKRDE